MLSTSATLLQRLQDQGDEGAWTRFVDLYGPLVRAWLRRHLPQEADVDDLAQQVFTVVVEKFPAFEHAGRPGAFRA
jgi:RNA polymerase sigma-70 factor (ECF subfamily)